MHLHIYVSVRGRRERQPARPRPRPSVRQTFRPVSTSNDHRGVPQFPKAAVSIALAGAKRPVASTA
eukprot:1025636-Lingulodinium_polyedra.AAC.1